MSAFQIILLVIAGVTLFSLFDMKKMFSSSEPSQDDGHFLQVVRDWEIFKQSCDKKGLVEASIKLDEIFPLLINLRIPEETDIKKIVEESNDV
tara:strand:- start:1153 stop:1431 length:279 start_codon:yes stop_codon:yes gene_type:complete